MEEFIVDKIKLGRGIMVKIGKRTAQKILAVWIFYAVGYHLTCLFMFLGLKVTEAVPSVIFFMLAVELSSIVITASYEVKTMRREISPLLSPVAIFYVMLAPAGWLFFADPEEETVTNKNLQKKEEEKTSCGQN